MSDEADPPVVVPAELLPEKRPVGRPRGKPKTGGRAKGISNLHALRPGMTTRELRDHVASICAMREFDPISTMCLLGKNKALAPKLRYQIAAEVASFIYPRIKHLELTGQDGAPLNGAPALAILDGLDGAQLSVLVTALRAAGPFPHAVDVTPDDAVVPLPQPPRWPG